MDAGAWEWTHSMARQWVPISNDLLNSQLSRSCISSILIHMVYLLPFLSHLAGSKSFSARSSDPDTMANAALEATVERQK